MENTIDVDVVQVLPPQQVSLTKGAIYYQIFTPSVCVENHLGVEFIVSYGNVSTSGAIEFLVQHSDLESVDFTSAAHDDLLGTEDLLNIPAAGSRTSGVDQNIARRIGYRGNRPYIRAGFKSRNPATLTLAVDAVLLKVNRG